MTSRNAGAVYLALVFSVALHAKSRPPSDWASVAQIAAGKRTEVRLKDGSRSSGTFVRAERQSVVVRTTKGETVYETTNVARVRVRKGLSRVDKVMIAVGAGAAVGGGIGKGLGTGNGEGIAFLVSVGVLAGIGGGIGAAVGAVLPLGWRTVYQAADP